MTAVDDRVFLIRNSTTVMESCLFGGPPNRNKAKDEQNELLMGTSIPVTPRSFDLHVGFALMSRNVWVVRKLCADCSQRAWCVCTEPGAAVPVMLAAAQAGRAHRLHADGEGETQQRRPRCSRLPPR